jgi:hypothetical protein
VGASRGSSVGERGNDLDQFYQYIHHAPGLPGGNRSGCGYDVFSPDLVTGYHQKILQLRRHRRLREPAQCGPQATFDARLIVHFLTISN